MPRKSVNTPSKRKADEMAEEQKSASASVSKKVKKSNFAEAILDTARVDLDFNNQNDKNSLSPQPQASKSASKAKTALRLSNKLKELEALVHKEDKNSDDELMFKRTQKTKKLESKKKVAIDTPDFTNKLDKEPTPNKIQTRTKTNTRPRNNYFDELFETGDSEEKAKPAISSPKSKSASNTPIKSRGKKKITEVEDNKPSKVEEKPKREQTPNRRKSRVLIPLKPVTSEDLIESPKLDDEKLSPLNEQTETKRKRDKSPRKSVSKSKKAEKAAKEDRDESFEKPEPRESTESLGSKKRGRPPKNKSVDDNSAKKPSKKKAKDEESEEEPNTPPPKSTKKKLVVEDDDDDNDELAIGSKSRLARPSSIVQRKKIEGTHHKDKKIDIILKKIDDAVLKLQEYTLPDKIPCRETEKEIIQKFVEEGLASDGLSHCLYISGVPGIGKTISVLEILKQIREENHKKDFNFIHINGLNMINPENIYQILVKEVTKITNVTNSTACLILDSVFQKGTLPKSYKQYQNQIDKRVRVVLLDEMDYMITKDQTLLYNLFDWTQQKNAKLVMIGIANTMNLKDQFLPKIQSRMGDRSLVYKPYTSQQIEQILLNRVEGMDIIQTETLKFLSKKIATFSSDIRRTLHVCREALRICAEEIVKIHEKDPSQVKDKDVLTIDHIRASHSLIYSNPYHLCMEMMSETTKLVLIAIAMDIKYKGQMYANLSELSERLRSIFVKLNRKPLKIIEITGIIKQLIALGIVAEKQKSYLRRDKNETNATQYTNLNDNQISLKITVDDLSNSLRNDETLSKFLD